MCIGKENQDANQAERKISTDGPKHAEPARKRKTQKQYRENTLASTTGGSFISVSGGTMPAIGSSATTTGIAKAGGTGSSAIEEKAGDS